MRIDGRRDESHLAFNHSAARRGDFHGLPRRDALQFARRYFGAPFKAILADQAKQFHAWRGHRAYRGIALRNYAVVRRGDAGVRHAHFFSFEPCALRVQACGGSFFRCEPLRGLLRRNHAFGFEIACAISVAVGFCQRGFGLGDIRFHLRQIRRQAFAGKAREQLPALDHIAHLGIDFNQAQAVGLGANCGFLPRGDIAIRAQGAGPVSRFGLDGGHGEGGFGSKGRDGFVLREREEGKAEHRGGERHAVDRMHHTLSTRHRMDAATIKPRRPACGAPLQHMFLQKPLWWRLSKKLFVIWGSYRHTST